ncbi:MAG: DUF1289 domain-containing protein [Rhodospirillales bacterium]|nr:DUF1289 domain-containing protein [Rhodospirillales bacterium]
MANEAVCSPCIGVCKLDADTLICDGCLRSAEEIGLWRDADNRLRLFILDRVAERRNAEPEPPRSSYRVAENERQR